MRIKLEEIASRSGYSIATVSRVLSGKAKGRSQSVYDIIHTARDLGYKASLNQYDNIDIPIDVYIITIGEKSIIHGTKIAHHLRNKLGLIVVSDMLHAFPNFSSFHSLSRNQ